MIYTWKVNAKGNYYDFATTTPKADEALKLYMEATKDLYPCRSNNVRSIERIGEYCSYAEDSLKNASIEDLLSVLAGKEEVAVIDSNDMTFGVSIDFRDEDAKKYTIAINNFNRCKYAHNKEAAERLKKGL